MDEKPIASNGRFTPPYMAFKTFLTFIESLAEKPLPPSIDRTMMTGKSGTDQANLFNAFKGFRLIKDNLEVEDRLGKLVKADTRKATLAEIIKEAYPSQMKVSEKNGTPGQLSQSFDDFGAKLEGDTRRKAMTFFLHAARYAGLTLSPHFPTTRMGSGRPKSGTGKPRASKRRKTASTTPDASSQGGGEVIEVSFGGAGTVTISVDVRWLDLPDETFSSLRKSIRELEALGAEEDSDEPSEEVFDEGGDE